MTNKDIRQAYYILEKSAAWGGVAKAALRTAKQFGQGKTTLPTLGKQVKGLYKSTKAHAKKDWGRAKKYWENI